MDSEPVSTFFYQPDAMAQVPEAVNYILIVTTILLIIVNWAVSGSKIAFFALSMQEIEEINADDATPRLKRVAKLLQQPERLLNSIIIAYNFINITIVAILAYLLWHIDFFGANSAFGVAIEIVVIVAFIAIFIDIAPKLLASKMPYKFARNSARIIYIINILAKPMAKILSKTTIETSKNSIEKRFEISMDDLSKALEMTSNEMTHDQGKEMLEGIIRFKDKTVDNILVSRTDMVSLDINIPFTKAIKFVVDAGFSRIPVFEDNQDNIKGILYVKDLLPHIDKTDDFKWPSLLRKAYFVPGTKRIDDLLEEFRANKNHMAIVVDEYGGTSGIVTMEDILEEIVGDICDEYDDEQKPFYTIATDGSYIFEGRTPLDDFIKATGIDEKDFEKIKEDADTIAGLILELKGDFPNKKENVEFKKYIFQAEELNNRRITKVRFILPHLSENN